MLLVSCVSATSELDSSPTTLPIATLQVDGSELQVAVADDSAERRQGLRDRSSMPGGVDGVLFVYDRPTVTTFDMASVGFDLDVWWFDEDGHLLGSTRMETCPDQECVGYASPGPIMWALETNAGAFELSPDVSLSFPD